VLGWFEEYVALCAKSFGDRVKNWMVFDERNGIHRDWALWSAPMLPAK
jgi:beta-glucosidase/6-phospho-beta-glucosidase/beta-galactosidase